ncbi:hypothetical protein XENOCAPTIV_030491, partial [Xenoophorus captivus]
SLVTGSEHDVTLIAECIVRPPHSCPLCASRGAMLHFPVIILHRAAPEWVLLQHLLVSCTGWSYLLILYHILLFRKHWRQKESFAIVANSTPFGVSLVALPLFGGSLGWVSLSPSHLNSNTCVLQSAQHPGLYLVHLSGVPIAAPG